MNDLKKNQVRMTITATAREESFEDVHIVTTRGEDAPISSDALKITLPLLVAVQQMVDCGASLFDARDLLLAALKDVYGEDTEA